jgi:hypothetical protein
MSGDLRFDAGRVDLFEDAPQGRRTRQARLAGLQDGQQFGRMFLDPIGNRARRVLTARQARIEQGQ